MTISTPKAGFLTFRDLGWEAPGRPTHCLNLATLSAVSLSIVLLSPQTGAIYYPDLSHRELTPYHAYHYPQVGVEASFYHTGGSEAIRVVMGGTTLLDTLEEAGVLSHEAANRCRKEMEDVRVLVTLAALQYEEER